MTKLVNKKMNDATYKLRRKVIDVIYKLKNSGVDLPRIEVKITESHDRILGQALFNKHSIWITEESVNMAEEMLVHVVCHEIGHTVFKLQHDDKCPLMKPALDKAATWDQILEVLR